MRKHLVLTSLDTVEACDNSFNLSDRFLLASARAELSSKGTFSRFTGVGFATVGLGRFGVGPTVVGDLGGEGLCAGLDSTESVLENILGEDAGEEDAEEDGEQLGVLQIEELLFCS